jgi:molecular chaperone GrpE
MSKHRERGGDSTGNRSDIAGDGMPIDGIDPIERESQTGDLSPIESASEDLPDIVESGEPCGAKTDERDARIEELTKETVSLSAQVAELKDQYLRKIADYENFRKRMTREREDAISFANTSLLLDLIGIVDNFDRALQATNESKDPGHLRDGIGLIERQMLSMLENKWGLVKFSCKGADFDPEAHEAIAREDRDDVAEPIVVDEFLAGYRLHGRIIRTAKVKVGMPKPGRNSVAAADNATGPIGEGTASGTAEALNEETGKE